MTIHNRKTGRFTPKVFIAAIMFALAGNANSQQLDLKALLNKNRLEVINREAVLSSDGVYLNERDREGFAWLPDLLFAEGTIEVDVKGKDVRGQSFVGMAFHAVDSSTFDAVYLRPFNFRSPDRKKHSVQYISAPRFGWETLRQQYPGKYENEIQPAPDPTGWIHLKIVITGKEIAVYIDNNPEPSLKVTKLSEVTTGKVGLWVGNGSGGEFRNLSLTIKRS